MAKITSPIRFSTLFGVPAESLTDLDVLDPSLNVDTKLFIDPFLLSDSKHQEIAEGARRTYERHFQMVIKLLARSKVIGDVAWRSAQRLMEFPEVKWTCLGFGASSVSGSGSGAFTTAAVMQTAKEIVDLGVDDPDLFVALGVFEDGIGPDRISDMTANVILPDLLAFNLRVLKQMRVPTKMVTLALKSGTYQAELPINPFQKRETPIVLVPADILRDLPIVNDWSDIADAAAKNSALRAKVNAEIAKIWQRKTLRDKGKLRRWATSSRDTFLLYLELLHSAKSAPYDMAGDPLGELAWRRIAETIAAEQPFNIITPKALNGESIAKVVRDIISQFQFLIEHRRLSEELYYRGRHRPEKAAQRLFFAIAYAYCKANNLDITPEAETGNGPVDFKVSVGFSGRVLVEIKLSTNSKIIAGYSKQLKAYQDAEEAVHAFYVVIDVGEMGRKAEELLKLKNSQASTSQATPEIFLIDGVRRLSASKL